MMNQRGALLVEELPSVLKKHGHEFLQIRIMLGDKVIESNLQEELILGEAKFDPFMLMDALDRCPAVIAFWNTLLVEVRESQKIAERNHKVAESQVKNLIAKNINANRTGTKAPSAAEIDATYHEFFVAESNIDELAGEFSHDDIVETPEEIYELYIRLRDASHLLSELNGQVSKIEIVHTAWKEKGFMLKSQTDLIQTLINQGLINIPQHRAVYAEW